MLNEECKLCDISTEVFDIIQHKNLKQYVYVVKDFAYITFSSKFVYNLEMDEFIIFLIRPTIKSEFMTNEDVKYKKLCECEDIKKQSKVYKKE